MPKTTSLCARRKTMSFLYKNCKNNSLYQKFLPDGREAIANKFMTTIISGTPSIQEKETFSKLEFLSFTQLENFPISPDLKLFLPELKKRFL